MLSSKKINSIIIFITVVAVILSVFSLVFSDIFSFVSKDSVYTKGYEEFFESSIINIEITADKDAWDDMIENKMSKPYISCDMVINGEEFEKVGIRPKGNSSLTSTTGQRVSFRLDFDHYVKNQNFHGLTKFVLNNTQADATYMKDYVAYDLMEYVGVKAPLHTFANISLNGEPFGVYVAVELYDSDYIDRVFNDSSVRLYNVKSSGLDTFENAVIDPETCKVISYEGKEQAQGMGGPGGPPPGPPPGAGGQNMMPRPPGMEGQNAVSEQSTTGSQETMSEQSTTDSQNDVSESSESDIQNRDRKDFMDQMEPAPENNSVNNQQLQGNVPQLGNQPNVENNIQGGQPPQPPGGGPGEMAGGGDLVYTDDSTASYKNIFANSVFDDTSAEDYARVIRAIKYLNKENVTKEELEKYWDVDGLLRYLAVHTFMVNTDSYCSNMAQNYYLAEQNGKITVLPWDYNLSFGAFGGGPGMDMNSSSIDKTTQTINFPIDTPVQGVEMEDRPLISVLLGFDEYKQEYYDHLDMLTDYIPNEFIDKLDVVENEIYPYIAKDATAFYTPSEHSVGFGVMKKFLDKRCQSIKAQLKGDIPSTEEGQKESSNLVTADFSVDEMGTMHNGGGAPPDMGGNPPGADVNNNGMMPPPGMNGNNNGMMLPPGADGNNGMMPPPPGMNGNNNGMMPPPPPGFETQSTSLGTGELITIFVSVSLLILGLVTVMLFKRKI